MSFGNTVWERGLEGTDELSERRYISAVSGFTVYGLLLTSLIAFQTMAWHPNLLVYLLIGLAVPIAGIVIALASDLWYVSLLGYTLVLGGLGAIIGPTVAMYNTGVVISAVMATAGVTAVTSLIGILYPKSLESWGIYLFGGLVALLFVRLAQVIMASVGVSEGIWYMPWIEYLAAILFSLYIIYDWNRSLRLTRTLDNAVDCALAIYLDIINLFLVILRIRGGSGSDD